LVSCFATTTNVSTQSVKDISVYKVVDSPPRQFPLKICVEHRFSPEQQEAIYQALLDWRNFSDNKISYAIQFGWHPEKPFSEYNYYNYPCITVWKRAWNDVGIFDILMKTSFVAHGFAIDNFIVVVDRDDLSYWTTYSIFKHEFGHTLGMQHIKSKFPALMNLDANRGSFSEYDKIMFCHIYSCQ
jgi:hypothetical protein